MSEKLAVVGPHKGYHLPPVVEFLTALHKSHPDTIVVSGGADGVDVCGEQTWLDLGGRVISLRPKRIHEDEWGIERWELGFERPKVFMLTDHLTATDFRGAAFIRNILIAEECTRLAAFYSGRRSMGASFTEGWAHDIGRPTFAFGLKG